MLEIVFWRPFGRWRALKNWYAEWEPKVQWEIIEAFTLLGLPELKRQKPLLEYLFSHFITYVQQISCFCFTFLLIVHFNELNTKQ